MLSIEAGVVCAATRNGEGEPAWRPGQAEIGRQSGDFCWEASLTHVQKWMTILENQA